MRPGFDFESPGQWRPDGPFLWHHGPFHGFSLPSHYAIPLLLLWALLYLVPTVVAYRRHHHNRAAIALLNVLLGWTFIGWVLALVWAVTAVKGGRGTGGTAA